MKMEEGEQQMDIGAWQYHWHSRSIPPVSAAKLQHLQLAMAQPLRYGTPIHRLEDDKLLPPSSQMLELNLLRRSHL